MRWDRTPFTSNMTRTQTILGWCYLPVHIVVLPLFLGMYAAFALETLDEVALNMVYYGAGAAFVLIFMLKYLRRDFDTLIDRPGQSALTVVMGYFINILLSYGAVLLLQYLTASISNPNSDLVAEMAGEDYSAVFGLAVLIGPLVEEVLFRGVVFGSIRRKNRVLAYAVSMALFSVYHIWQFVVAYGDPTLFLYALQYLPVSFALAWTYERSGSLWTSVFLHMFINALSLYAMNLTA